MWVIIWKYQICNWLFIIIWKYQIYNIIQLYYVERGQIWSKYVETIWGHRKISGTQISGQCCQENRADHKRFGETWELQKNMASWKRGETGETCSIILGVQDGSRLNLLLSILSHVQWKVCTSCPLYFPLRVGPFFTHSFPVAFKAPKNWANMGFQVGLSMGYPKCWWWINLCFFMFATGHWPSFFVYRFSTRCFFVPSPPLWPWQKETPVYPHPGRRPTAWLANETWRIPLKNRVALSWFFWGKSTGNMAVINVIYGGNSVTSIFSSSNAEKGGKFSWTSAVSDVSLDPEFAI